MATKREALTLANKLTGGRRLKLVAKIDRKAPNAAERERLGERLATLSKIIGDSEAVSASIDKRIADLKSAARFVVDVAGDPPSIDELRRALATIEAADAIDEVRRSAIKERVAIVDHLAYFRCGIYRPTAIADRVVAVGSDWSEVIENLKAKGNVE